MGTRGYGHTSGALGWTYLGVRAPTLRCMDHDPSPADLLIPLDVPPRDAANAVDALERADSVVYRLGLRAMPVLNLPDHLDVGGVRADVVRGPVLTQRTMMRQRAGVLPVTFDKYMVREPIGEGEQLLILSIHETAVPKDVEASFLLWRQRAEAAAGALAAVLDERVVGMRVFEDAVLLAGGETIGAMDWQERVRSYLPLDVTAIDRPALEALRDITLGDGSAIARAARLYRRAALEGPTADGYVMLFVATEALLETRQPRKTDLDLLLADAGIDPDVLPLHSGLLISLRGKIVHEGLEDHEHLRTAFYEMEAVVRTLIRKTAGLRGGWWPTHDIAAFAHPWPERLDARDSRPRSEWHDDGLPPVAAAAPVRLPRNVASPDRELLVTLTEELRDAAGDHAELLAGIAADARMHLNPDDGCELVLDIGSGAGFDIELSRILIGDERLAGLDEIPRFVGLTIDLTGVLGYWVALRTIGGTTDDEVTLRSAIAAWYQYDRLVVNGELPPELLKLPTTATSMSVGTLAGWACAGDDRAKAAVDSLEGRAGDLARATRDALRESPPSPPRPVLDW